MDVQIDEMQSTIRVTDSAALLSPQLLEAIVRATSARLRELMAQEKRSDADRQLNDRIFSPEERKRR